MQLKICILSAWDDRHDCLATTYDYLNGGIVVLTSSRLSFYVHNLFQLITRGNIKIRSRWSIGILKFYLGIDWRECCSGASGRAHFRLNIQIDKLCDRALKFVANEIAYEARVGGSAPDSFLSFIRRKGDDA